MCFLLAYSFVVASSPQHLRLTLDWWPAAKVNRSNVQYSMLMAQWLLSHASDCTHVLQRSPTVFLPNADGHAPVRRARPTVVSPSGQSGENAYLRASCFALLVDDGLEKTAPGLSVWSSLRSLSLSQARSFSTPTTSHPILASKKWRLSLLVRLPTSHPTHPRSHLTPASLSIPTLTTPS